MQSDTWTCKKCGGCCGRFVYSGPRIELKEKIDKIAEKVKELDIDERYITQLRRDQTIPVKGKKPPKKCIFLEGNNCQIQEIKPIQCLDYPIEIVSKNSNEVKILIDCYCPRSEDIRDDISGGNISSRINTRLSGRKIGEVRIKSFFEEKMNR